MGFARTVYQRLEKLKGYAGQAEYLQAYAAFQQKDTGAAITLAQRASDNSTNATDKRHAQLLYGDALFQQGYWDRAKTIYGGLLPQTADEALKNTIKRKIASCDAAIAKAPKQ